MTSLVVLISILYMSLLTYLWSDLTNSLPLLTAQAQQSDLTPVPTQSGANVSNGSALQTNITSLLNESISPSNITFAKYANSDFGISIDYPKSWRVYPNGLRDYSAVVSFFSPLEI